MNRNERKRRIAILGGSILLGFALPGTAEETLSPLDAGQHPATPQYESLFPEQVLPLNLRLSWKDRFAGDETFNSKESLPQTSPKIGKLVLDGDGHADSAAGAISRAYDTTGIVRQVRRDDGKVKVEHGPIDRLGMPGMTMVFRVEDPALLAGLEKGAEIDFDVENSAAGFTITRIDGQAEESVERYDARGTIKSVRADQGKVKIEHGPIDRLGMPGMTMVFKLKNASDLNRLARDMEIEFDVANGPGGFEITRVRPVSGAALNRVSAMAAADRACFKVGPFANRAGALALADRYRDRGATIELSSKAERRYVGEMVYIDGLGSRDAALATARKLAANGIRDTLVLAEAGKRNALSLGVYGLRENAEQIKARVESMQYEVKTEARYRESGTFWIRGEQSGVQSAPDMLAAAETRAGIRHTATPCAAEEAS